MKFKIKKKPKQIFKNEFLFFPKKYKGYIYWLCWCTVRYNWIGFRYQKFGKMVTVGKQAKLMNKQFTL
jgi:hypothetical protein